MGRGIHVDDQMVTSDADILAIGECVEHMTAQVFGLVAPLYDQAKVAAADAGRGGRGISPIATTATKLKVTGVRSVFRRRFRRGR